MSFAAPCLVAGVGRKGRARRFESGPACHVPGGPFEEADISRAGGAGGCHGLPGRVPRGLHRPFYRYVNRTPGIDISRCAVVGVRGRERGDFGNVWKRKGSGGRGLRMASGCREGFAERIFGVLKQKPSGASRRACSPAGGDAGDGAEATSRVRAWRPTSGGGDENENAPGGGAGRGV